MKLLWQIISFPLAVLAGVWFVTVLCHAINVLVAYIKGDEERLKELTTPNEYRK